MQRPIMPLATAEQDKRAWDAYWQASKRWGDHVRNERRREYRRAYYAKRTAATTRQRQIAKLRALIEAYPEEARAMIEVLR